MERMLRTLDFFIDGILSGKYFCSYFTPGFREALVIWLKAELLNWQEYSPTIVHLSKRADENEEYADFVLDVPGPLTHTDKAVLELGFDHLTDYGLALFSINPVAIGNAKSALQLLLGPSAVSGKQMKRARRKCCGAILGVNAERVTRTWGPLIKAIRA